MKKIARLLTFVLTITTITVFGQTNLHFNGIGFTIINQPSANDFYVGSGDFTWQCWIRTSDSGPFKSVISSYTNSGAKFFFGVSTGKVWAAPGNQSDAIGTTIISDGNWHFISATRRYGELIVYVDGIAEDTVSNMASITSSVGLDIGRINGEVDMLTLWDDARTPSEINQDMNGCGYTGSEPNLLAYFPFDEGTGNTTSDITNTYQANFTNGLDTVSNVWGIDAKVATSIDTRTECAPYTWIDGSTYTANNDSATFKVAGGGANGCDSLVILDLTINNLGTDTKTECNAYTWIDGNTYTTSNNAATFTIISGAANGCDSLVTLNLTIINSATGTDTKTECNSYSWIDGNTYTASNNTATFTIDGGAANGCDSLVTLDLTINNVSDVTTSISGTTISANNTNASYRWIDCDNNSEVIANETGQSFSTSSNGNYAVELTENGCVDTTTCVAITAVGVIENSFGNNLQIYPNPTHGNFSIELGTIFENLEVLITDLSGKVIISKNIAPSKIVNLSIEEPAGIYIVSIRAGNQKAVIRLIKE